MKQYQTHFYWTENKAIFRFTLLCPEERFSGPFCDLDIEPDQIFVWKSPGKSHVRQQFFAFEDFCCQKKKKPAWFR